MTDFATGHYTDDTCSRGKLRSSDTLARTNSNCLQLILESAHGTSVQHEPVH